MNEEIADAVTRYRGKFVGLATLPMQDMDECLKEFDRAVNVLKLRGAMIFSNIHGRLLDSKEFIPLYEKAAEYTVPLFIHPTTPSSTAGLDEYGLTIIIGLLFDSSLAISRLIFSGILEKVPELKFVLAHLGSTIPFIAARLDIESELLSRFVPGYTLGITSKPSEQFRKVYLDTVSHHGPAYKCALSYPGIDKILLGSDYPYSLWERTVTAIDELDIDQRTKEKIFSENAIKLFGIKLNS